MERDGWIPVVKEAWKAFECAAPSSRVCPAMPILFFGDLEAYSTSPFRVVTVGLNPSLQEWPARHFLYQQKRENLTKTEGVRAHPTENSQPAWP